jgi:23S rRNA (cytosine1962-C5)-methyltransferase
VSSFPEVQLNSYEIRRIRQGHPWIYEKSIRSLPEGIQTGDQVHVRGSGGEHLGTAIYNADSKIRLRLLTREDRAIDQSFFEKRLTQALEYRKRWLPNRKSFRLINAESDGLSGVIVDCYEDACLFQITSAGIEQRKEALMQAIRTVLHPGILIERNDVSNRKFEGLPEILKVHESRLNEEQLQAFRIQIDQVAYEINLIEGNKTGLYLDQIDNHAHFSRLMQRYPQAKVLDCFSYIGGFSLSAAMSGNAAHVLGLDQSAECIEKARTNARINGVEALCQFERANVFDYLRDAAADPSRIGSYDLIVLDPPSFTKNRNTVEGALRGYKELHVRAFKLLASGGALLTYSCSHHIHDDLLRSVVHEAASDTASQVTEIESHRQALDHPIVPSIPESYYLKGFVYCKRSQ